MEFGNQAIDYKEDLEAGVRTPPVRWGLRRSLVIGLILLALGVVVEIVSLLFMFLEKHAADPLSLSSLSPSTMMYAYVLGAALVISGYILPLHKYV